MSARPLDARTDASTPLPVPSPTMSTPSFAYIEASSSPTLRRT